MTCIYCGIAEPEGFPNCYGDGNYRKFALSPPYPTRPRRRMSASNGRPDTSSISPSGQQSFAEYHPNIANYDTERHSVMEQRLENLRNIRGDVSEATEECVAICMTGMSAPTNFYTFLQHCHNWCFLFMRYKM
uniref:Uncharacterized protein n=1 Tax=Ditylenchus dipsaci TaxID=166011 RepID=A0A915CS61_9BILA